MKPTVTSNSNIITYINNKVLPLAYVECKGFRIFLPLRNSENFEAAKEDVVVFQVDSINLVPDPVNPICRTPLKPNVFQQAARARILNIPGK